MIKPDKKDSMHLLLVLATLVWLQPAWCGEAKIAALDEYINEPIFESKVCTVQANHNAKTGVILIHGLDGSYEDWKRTIPATGNLHTFKIMKNEEL